MRQRWLYVLLAAGLLLGLVQPVVAGKDGLDAGKAAPEDLGNNAPDAAAPDVREAAGPAITLGKSVFGNGGGRIAGSPWIVVGTLGQTFAFSPTTTGPLPITNHLCSGWWCVELSGVLAGPDADLPKQVAFGLPYPNPSNGNLTMDFALPREARIEVQLLDVMGRRVVALARGRFDAGEHALSWDGRNETGSLVQAGVYFMRMRVDGSEVGRRRVVVVR